MVEQIEIKDDGSMKNAPNESTAEAKPSWLPEKFNNAEELAKAYTELEKSYSQKGTEDSTLDQATESKEAAEQATGLNLDSYYKEFEEQGSLTDDSYTKLQASGLSKELVDSYIAGQNAIADNHTRQIKQAAGSDADYEKVTEWASQNMNEKEIATFNKIVENGTIEEATLAVQGMKARHDNSVGVTPQLIQGDAAQSNSAYQSTAEIVSAINDPRYAIDTAYRKTVEVKIKRSNAIG